jgi:calcium-dependent protein kinase
MDWVFPEQNHKDVSKDYDLGRQLGQPGQFGIARVATSKQDGHKFAVKVINKSKFSLSSQKRAFFAQMKDEINIMSRLDHPNIIRFNGVYEDSFNVNIVMELCTGGELFDRIQDRGSYSEADAAQVLREIVEGIQYLHANQIAHCDLKPDNFLFLDKSESAPCKIIDFGMSKIVKARQYFKKFCGTPYYVAPEVIDGRYNEACDMWSIGVVCFVMIFGYPPFYCDPNTANADAKILSKVKRGFIPEVRRNYGPWFPEAIPCSESVRDFLSKLLQLNTADRMTAEEALDHPWLRGETASKEPLSPTVLKSLKEFRAAERFKQAVLQMMTDLLDEKQIADLRVQFSAMDADGDGKVTLKELKDALMSADPTVSEQDAVRIMNAVDVDNDGTISYEELLMTTVHRHLQAKEERLWRAFRRMDLDGDGRVTVSELQTVLGKDKNEDEIRDLVKEVDIDGDGTIDFEEFLRLFHRTASRRLSQDEEDVNSP